MANDANPEAGAAGGIKPLPPADLRKESDPRLLAFKTTADITPLSGFFGSTDAL